MINNIINDGRLANTIEQNHTNIINNIINDSRLENLVGLWNIATINEGRNVTNNPYIISNSHIINDPYIIRNLDRENSDTNFNRRRYEVVRYFTNRGTRVSSKTCSPHSSTKDDGCVTECQICFNDRFCTLSHNKKCERMCTDCRNKVTLCPFCRQSLPSISV